MDWGLDRDEQHLRFRLQLEGTRLDQIFADKKWMQELRHNYDQLQNFKQALRHILAFRDLDLEQEIIDRSTPKPPKPTTPTPKMSPAGGSWDAEDDEKQGGTPASHAHDDSCTSSCSSP